MSIKKLILVFSAMIALACMVGAQDKTQDQPKTTIQHAAVKSTSPASGKDIVRARRRGKGRR